MASATLTREEKIREARRLRSTGLNSTQISERLDVSASTVRNWCLGSDCPDCGAPVDGSNGGESSSKCQKCATQDVVASLQSAARERTQRFIELRKQGLRNDEIARRERTTSAVVATVLHRAPRYGLDAGRSPYFRATEAA